MRKIDNLDKNEYLFNHSSQNEWLLKLSLSKYKNYNLDSLLSLNDVERGNVIFLLSRPCVCKKDIYTIICENYPKSFTDYCYDLRNIKNDILKEIKKLVLTKYIKSAIIDYSQIERYSNKSLIFEELKQLSKEHFNFNIFITYNLPRKFESQKNKLPTLRQINKMTEFKYILCKVIGVGLKEDLETNVYKVYKTK